MGGGNPREGIASELLDPLIYVVRGHRVMLDADLARLYGVATMRFNEAFKRNRRRFPADFAFQLTAVESSNLKSQTAISSSQSVDSVGEISMSAQTATRLHGGRRHLPWVFTDHDRNLVQHDAALRDIYRKLLPLLQPPPDPPRRRIGFHTDGE